MLNPILYHKGDEIATAPWADVAQVVKEPLCSVFVKSPLSSNSEVGMSPWSYGYGRKGLKISTHTFHFEIQSIHFQFGEPFRERERTIYHWFVNHSRYREGIESIYSWDAIPCLNQPLKSVVDPELSRAGVRDSKTADTPLSRQCDPATVVELTDTRKATATSSPGDGTTATSELTVICLYCNSYYITFDFELPLGMLSAIIFPAEDGTTKRSIIEFANMTIREFSPIENSFVVLLLGV
ncbi:RNA-binding (RRM/RBD/RNP motifs) family protein [Striga asiatica]|uniref:RNA-binding (RRM/RBD/RNP motifs) family protein n=1 Tax=Striga asiatica TaxID=4170 RepID=A0A5A7PZA4_STRAF|nr:RNA-binding (RRM/RBD/RNP motifs) family protein [Striga asiatica]